MKLIIKNANIVTRDEVLYGADLLVVDGRIAEIGDIKACADSVLDGTDLWLVPGFIDLHCHGGGGYGLMDATEDSVRGTVAHHLSHGTTTLLATTLASNDEERDSVLEIVGKHIANNPTTTIVGVHLEGPWLNPAQCGAQNPQYIRSPRKGELTDLKQKYPFILRVSAAPEIDGGMIAGEAAALGVLMSVAHTDADFAEVEAANRHGYRLMTHLYSGMNGVIRKNSFRVAGAVEAGLYLDDMYVELIADGKHLPYELLRYVYKIKGADRICLVTDAIRASGMPEGAKTKIGSIVSGLDVIVEDGVAKLPDRQSFAGSTATMDRVYRTMIEATGADMVSASRMASLNPAVLLGLTDRGEIAEGKRADLVLLDKNLNIKNVIKNGEII